MNRLKLPTGIQTFEKLRKKHCVYVDKTKYFVDLIDRFDICFFARPRRFGKSLTVTTFEALFSGKKELFTGLYAEEFLNRPDFESSPVIRLDMSSVTTDAGIDTLKDSIKQLVLEVADKLNIELPQKDLPEGDLLRKLIINTANKYERKVVILLDEYDKPYTDFVNDTDMAEKVRNVLRSFYIQIKSNDEYIRFTFITGISKFAKFGVFSTLNTPKDISLMPEYAAMCGYTEEEIIRYFPDYLEDTAKYMRITTDELIEKMRRYYNGFSFAFDTSVCLYNPYSTLSFFEDKEFLNYWIDTGKPKFIAEYMKNRHLTVEQFQNLSISKDFARSPGDVDSAPPEGFLYQSGYLTLRPGNRDELSLDYPNTEVLNSMSSLLAQNILAKDMTNIRRNLFTALDENNIDNLVEQLNRLLASIPYDDYSDAAQDSVRNKGYHFSALECIYRSSIFCYMQGCGVVIQAEMHNHLGRPDLVITYKGKIWVIEIKVAFEGQSAASKADEGMKQIIKQQYAKPYPNALCISLGIDDSQRQITVYRKKIP